ncbi:hypothetical protein TrCOL_g3186 [Triparma columacea]|uniref:Uncharacterized protein n=1 Tax=Triparma columacea TaxID=722753 RepID=A0A9W7L9C3_9STRA|nr:hypothetical protein TrCOL_g3186 [Triparma columacea]
MATPTATGMTAIARSVEICDDRKTLCRNIVIMGARERRVWLKDTGTRERERLPTATFRVKRKEYRRDGRGVEGRRRRRLRGGRRRREEGRVQGALSLLCVGGLTDLAWELIA